MKLISTKSCWINIMELISVGNLNEGGDIGLDGSTFLIGFQVNGIDHLYDGDIVIPTINKSIEVVITGDMISGGVYKSFLYDDDPHQFLPEEYLTTGVKWIKK